MLPNVLRPTDSSLADADIVRLVAAGDERAFVLLMRRHNRILYRTARSIVKDDAEAEDVLQDAYLLAFRAMKNFRGDAKLSTWLTRIVVNEAVARKRKATRRGEVILLNGDAEADMHEAATGQPERAAERAEARRLLERNIDRLPDAFRSVFVLRALEELSVEETAACLEIPEATVRSRFFRARSMLREALSREIDGAYEDAFSFDGARCDRIVAGVLDRVRAQCNTDA